MKSVDDNYITREIFFDSPIMPNDRLVIQGENMEDIQNEYLSWWERYGGDKDFALSQVICIRKVNNEEC